MIDDAAVVLEDALAAAGNDACVASSSIDHQWAFTQRSRLGLLTVDIFAVAAGFDHHDRVPMVGSRDMHGIDVGSREQFAEVVVGLAVLVLIMCVGSGLGGVADAGSYFGHRNVLHVAASHEGSHIPLPHVADPDASHHDPVTCRRAV